jgi:flagellar basal body-associated protein FliL
VDENQESPKVAKKGGGGRIIAIIVGVVVLLGGMAIGTLFGSKLMGNGGVAEAAPAPKKSHAAREKKDHDEEEEDEEESDDPEHKITSVEFEPIVLDLRDSHDAVHHLKVGLAVELTEKEKPEEFHALIPRGRQAVISYLRALTFEEVSKPDQFQKVREDIAQAVTKAVGARRVSRVLLVDFVAQ